MFGQNKTHSKCINVTSICMLFILFIISDERNLQLKGIYRLNANQIDRNVYIFIESYGKRCMHRFLVPMVYTRFSWNIDTIIIWMTYWNHPRLYKCQNENIKIKKIISNIFFLNVQKYKSIILIERMKTISNILITEY